MQGPTAGFSRLGIVVKAAVFAFVAALLLTYAPPTTVAVAPSTSTSTQGATFNSGSIDLWAPFGSQADWTLIDQSFNTGDLSDSGTVSVPGAGGVSGTFDASGCSSDLLDCFSSPGDYFSVSVRNADIGAGASFSLKGKFAFFGSADGMSGSASVQYPVSAQLSYPTAESFMPGDAVTLGGSWTAASGATINAASTTGDIQLDGDLGLGSSASVCAYVPGAECGALYPTFDWQSGKTTMFSVAAGNSVPEIPSGLVGVGGTLRSLSVTPSSISAGPGGSVIAQGTNAFSDVVFDLDRIAFALASAGGAEGLPKLEQTVNLTGAGIPLEAGYNVFDAEAHVGLSATQTLSFRDPRVTVRYAFSRPMAGFTGPVTATAPDNSWAEARLGDDIGVQFPTDETQPVTVTPTVSLGGMLHNSTKLDTDGRIELKAGIFKLTVPGFQVFPAIGGFNTGLKYPEPLFDDHWHDIEVCDPIFGTGCETICTSCLLHLHDAGIRWHDIVVPPVGPWSFPGFSFDIGPLWGPQNFAPSRTTDTLADGDIAVANFAPVTLQSIVLNPQNKPVPHVDGPYEVNEGSSVTMSAAGSTDADGDALTYAWDFEDDGDVDATGVTASYFGEDGPTTHVIRMTACDTNGNCVPTFTVVRVGNVNPTAVLHVPTIIGRDNPLTLSLKDAHDASLIDEAAGFLYAFDCRDGSGYSDFRTENDITCTGTLDGVHAVSGMVMDKDGGITEYGGTVMLDRTPPEAYNVFDVPAKDVRVYARDGLSGVPAGPIPPFAVASVPWSADDPTAAELRTHRIVDGAGNDLVLVEKVKKYGSEEKVTVVSLAYNGAPAITPPTNSKHFEWSVQKNGALKSLNQKMAVDGSTKSSVHALYDTAKNVTSIKSGTGSPIPWSGLKLLRLATDQGGLVIEY